MGKNCIVTGATSGLGLEIARKLAGRGHRVGVVGRTLDRAVSAAGCIRSKIPAATLEILSADLASPEEVRQLAERVRIDFDPLDILVQCAGCFYSRRSLTGNGTEATWAVNHLAVFQLTHDLLTVLQRSSGAHVLLVGSESHRQGRIHFDDPGLTRNYHGLRAYAQSKLANLLFTFEFRRRCPDGSPSISCVEPGLVRTAIGRKHASLLHSLLWRLQLELRSAAPPSGPATWIVQLADSEPAPPTGLYWSKGCPRKASSRAYREKDWNRLWEMSLKQCNIQDYFGPVATDRRD